MKKTIILCFAVYLLVFGLAGCKPDPKEPDETLEGKVWKSTDILILQFRYIHFDGTNYELRINQAGFDAYSEKGTYSKTADTITFTPSVRDPATGAAGTTPNSNGVWNASYTIIGTELLFDHKGQFIPKGSWAMMKISNWE